MDGRRPTDRPTTTMVDDDSQTDDTTTVDDDRRSATQMLDARMVNDGCTDDDG